MTATQHSEETVRNLAGADHGVGSESTVPERIIVRHCGDAHPHLCRYLVRKFLFLDLCRLPHANGIKSKAAHLRDIILDLFFLLRNVNRLRQAREIIGIGPMALNVALLLKLGLLPSCKRAYWFGLFVHSPRWLRILRLVFRFLDSKRIHFVIFSEFERTLYANALGLDASRISYIPYGNMNEEAEPEPDASVGESISKDPMLREFFFSGGYSNRDYLSLIETFKELPLNLVIICSRLNTEITDVPIPANVRVLRDMPSEKFDAYVKAAKACIIPIAHDTGAAGQSCLLRYMKYKKLIIATDTGIIREYVADGISGILVKNNREGLASAVRAVTIGVEKYQKYGDAAYKRYMEQFSSQAIARRIDQMMNQILEN
jgi:glycosyltransferase involved in cell wall biosynthesis